MYVLWHYLTVLDACYNFDEELTKSGTDRLKSVTIYANFREKTTTSNTRTSNVENGDYESLASKVI